MAGQRTLPGLGLTAYWDLGDNTYKAGVDSNFRTISALVQPNVLSIEATTPGSPVDGQMYLSSGTWGGGSANDIMLYDNGGWVPITPQQGWSLFNQDADKPMSFTGTDWIYPNDVVIVTGATTTFDLLDEHLDGRSVIEISNGGAVTFNLTAGLTALGPVTVINTGGGDIAFTEDVGVTLQSTFPNLKTQWGWVTIIPRGSDVFHVGGNLEAA